MSKEVYQVLTLLNVTFYSLSLVCIINLYLLLSLEEIAFYQCRIFTCGPMQFMIVNDQSCQQLSIDQ